MNIEFIKELTYLIKDNGLYKIEFKSKSGDEVKIFSSAGIDNMYGERESFNKQNNYSGEIDDLVYDEGFRALRNSRDNRNLDDRCDDVFLSSSNSDSAFSNEEVNNDGLDVSCEGEMSSVSYINSSMIGTFYSKPSPDENCFVKVGDIVSKGDTVCVIESMKLINELKSSCDCEILEILVNDEDIVEFGQKLFKVREING